MDSCGAAFWCVGFMKGTALVRDSPRNTVFYVIASGAPGFDVSKGFASNGYGAHSPAVIRQSYFDEPPLFSMMLMIVSPTTNTVPATISPNEIKNPTMRSSFMLLAYSQETSNQSTICHLQSRC
jgi:hypothetical protein